MIFYFILVIWNKRAVRR